MNIFAEVKKLNFPLGSYVVVGSGIMIALGLKEGTDVDIVVTEELFTKCLAGGWEQIPWTYPDHSTGTFLRKGLVELYLDVNCGNFQPTTQELIERAQIIDGIAFASPNDVLRFKKEYLKNKPKHEKDIQILENYLQKNL